MVRVTIEHQIDSCEHDAIGAHRVFTKLTAWFCQNIPYSSREIALDHHDEIAKTPLASILFDLMEARVGVMCGGSAVLMRILAAQLGYTAFVMNFGRRSGPESHVMVAARLSENRYGFYDPTFGTFIGNSQGAPANLPDIVRAMQSRDFRDLKKVDVWSGTRLYIVDRRDIEKFERDFPDITPDKRSERIVVRITTRELAQATFPAMVCWMRSMIPDAGEFDLFQFPINTSGESEAEELAKSFSRTYGPSPS
jgi:hypothetical protein